MVAYKGFGRINVTAANNSPTSISSIQDVFKNVSLTSSDTTARDRNGASKMDHIKRHSLPVLSNKLKDKEKGKEKEKRSQSPATRPLRPSNKLDLVVESPPNMFLKGPQESSGALFSAQLLLTVVDPEVTLETFEMRLNVVVTTKRPVVRDCSDCTSKSTELQKWTFINAPKKLSAGEHKFPFSYLFPGHLPAASQGHIGVLKYFLEARAKVKPTKASAFDFTDHMITLHREIPVFRAKEEHQDRGHTRLFPPTNLAAYVTFPPVVHPIGDINFTMRINGTVEKDEPKGILYRWRLRKLSWKLEEKETMISPACSKHSNKVGGEGKGIQYDETRIIGRGDTNSGWKTEMTDGKIEMEFPLVPFANPRPLCDVESPNGLRITHQLVVELVISEEWAKLKSPQTSVPSGSARVLRMQFPVEMTERAGMGISWDEETPPVYEDVPASPPVYPQRERAPAASQPLIATVSGGEVLDYTGPPLTPPPAFAEEFESGRELDGFRLGESRNSSVYSTGVADNEPSSSSGMPSARDPRTRRLFDLDDFDTAGR